MKPMQIKEEDRNGKMMASSGWTLSAVQVEMQHCDQSSTAQLSL